MKKCFVVMGFGQKTDYMASPPRLLDLNKTFDNIIAPTVTAAGLECIRADKIIHSTVIDKPMYEHLLQADLVIADLSTANVNAVYELGVRHALRPHSTIVMAEQGFSFPFDLNHLSILKYEHLGKDIGFDEVMRVRSALKAKIDKLVAEAASEIDSPVFLFLPDLLGMKAATPAPAPEAAPVDPQQKSLAELLELLKQAKKEVKVPSDWKKAIDVLGRLRQLQPNDPYLVQQHALATYKSELPDRFTALSSAKELLQINQPEASCDAETIGLWGAIHKRLWELTGSAGQLDVAVRAYARGYFIKNDYYNGINFAFLLSARAHGLQGDEAIADRVLARRIRGEVLALCETTLASAATPQSDVFWVKATKVEALVGMGRGDEAAVLKVELEKGPETEPWMLESMNGQLAKLVALAP